MDKEKIAWRIIQTLHRAGYEAYLAGGCVRDKIRGVAPKDFDIATSALPDGIQKLFAKTIPVGVQFGVILVVENETAFEVATFRSEGGYDDGRHPSHVKFCRLEEDAKRRDFTVNGLYFDTTANHVLDFVSGQPDIQKKIIRTIGDPTLRFLEDHLRMLRAVRFAVQLGFTIESDTLTAIAELAPRIERVSAERIRDELVKILTSKHPAEGLRLLDTLGLLPYVLPEVVKLKGVEQPPEYHPEGDVYVHTLLLLEQLFEAPIELAMGALLHDIAKPATFDRAPDRIRFHGHDKLGAQMAREICRRLTFPNHQTDLICSLVEEHLRFKDAFQMRLSTLKRFFSMHRFDLHLELHRIDCLASHKNLDAYDFCKNKMDEFSRLPPPPTRVVTGNDLVALGLAPGPHFSTILRAVEDAVLEGTIHSHEEGIKFVKANFLKSGRGQS